MTSMKSLLANAALFFALSNLTSASPALLNRQATAPCTNIGAVTELHFKRHNHSSPIYGVEIGDKKGVFTAVHQLNTSVTWQFAECTAPSTGYVQGAQTKEGHKDKYFGHLIHVSSGKCLQHHDKSHDFGLDDCPTEDVADKQLPFWFETPEAELHTVRYAGHRNMTAFPHSEWFHGKKHKVPFAISTESDGTKGKENDWVLARP